MKTATTAFRAVDGDLSCELVTPEGVALRLQLASAGQRAGAFGIDLAIIAACLVAMTILTGIIIAALGWHAIEMVGVIWLLGAFVLRNLWFILFEGGRRAATPGKRLFGIRVAVRTGGRLTTEAVVSRNLMRELEFFLPISFFGYQLEQGAADAWTALFGLGWSGLFLIFPLLNRDRLRPGDLVAGTWVLRNPRRNLGDDVLGRSSNADAFAFVFTDVQLSAYGIYELQTLEDVLRRSQPNPMRRPADDPMIAVAATIRQKIGWNGGEDYAFLAAYYAALRARLERDLLLGKRRADKRSN